MDLLEAPAERLGLWRFFVGSFTVIYLLARWPSFASVAQSSSAEFEPVGLALWLVGVVPSLSEPVSAFQAMSLYGLAVVSGVLFSLGVYYRAAAPVFAASLLWVTSWKSSFGMLFHSENLFTLHVVALAFAPASDAFAVVRSSGPSRTRGRWAYGIPLVTASCLTIIAYLVAGVAKMKLSGIDWLMGDTLRVQIAYDNLRKIELGSIHSPLGAWLVTVPWVFPILGLLTVAAELGGPLALVHRRIAVVWATLIVGFHYGVLALMAIAFAYPLSGIPLFCVFAIERLPGVARLRRAMKWMR